MKDTNVIVDFMINKQNCKYPKLLLIVTTFSSSFIIIGFISFLTGVIASDLGFAFVGSVGISIGLLVLGRCLRIGEKYKDGKKSI